MLVRIAALVGLLLSPVFASGQALADRVPADAMVYAGWRGVADLGPGYPQSNLKAVLDDCDVRQFIDDFLPAVLDRIGRENPQVSQVSEILGTIAKPSWRRPTAFFFAGVDLPQNGPPVPHLGVLWQPGRDTDSLLQQLQQLTAQAQPPFPLKVVRAGDLVALMVGYENAEAALGSAGKSLADDTTFKASLAQVMKDPVAAIYVDYQKLLETIGNVAKTADPQTAEQLDKVRRTLGLNGLKRIIATSGFDGKDWGTMAFVEVPEPRTGLLKMISSQPMSEQILSVIPQSSTMAGAGRADLTSLLPTLRDAVREVHPDVADQFDQFLKSITQQSGVDIEKDLIGSLGDEWAYFTDPTIGGSGLAGLTVVNRLKDPERFEQSLAKIEDFALQQIEQQLGPQAQLHLSFNTVQIDGVKVHYLAIPFVSPSWTVHDGRLYVAAFPQVAAAAARRQVDSSTSILHNPGFVAVRQRLGHADPIGLTFEDLPKTAPAAYGSWLVVTRLAGFGDLFGVKSPPVLLPELPKLLAHLSPAGSVKWVDAQGAHMRSIEPFPASTMVASDPAISAIYAEPVLVSIMLPALNKAREQANRVKSANNLKQIGLGAIMYANAHKGKFPPDLAAMAQEEELAASIFVNPRTPHPMPPPDVRTPRDVAAWAKENSDYTYVAAGKSVSAGADVVIAYEKSDEVTEGLNILFADGHVEWQPMAEAMRTIQSAK
jgi:prepilin-type processing-associated H-X9-DG protein